MNLKACCGLLANKDDEDHDYEDVAQEPLPKPQTAAEARKSQSGAPTNVYASAGYSSKALARSYDNEEARFKQAQKASQKRSSSDNQHKKAPALAESSINTRDSGSSGNSKARLEKAAWDAGTASAACTPAGAAAPPPPQLQPRPTGTSTWSANSVTSDRTAGTRSSSSGSVSGSAHRGPATAPASTSMLTSSSAGASRGRLEGTGSSGRGSTSTDAVRPRPKGAVGVGTEVARGGGEAGVGGRRRGGGGGGSSSSSRAAAAAAVPKGGATFDLRGFVGKLDRGVLLTKINRQGKAKVRTLFYDEPNKMLWWSEPGAAGRGATRPRSSSLLSLRKEQPLPVASLIQVKMASQLDEPFCFDGDVDKSFQLVFPARTVDLVARDAQEAGLLATGFQELKGSVV